MPTTYHLAFEYSTDAVPPEVLLGMIGAKERPDHSIAGVLKVAVTKEVVYSEWWFDGKLGYRQWDYPSGYAAYYPNLRALTFRKTGRYDVIPLWLPTKEGPRKFLRAANECKVEKDLCIEKPGAGQIPLGAHSEKVGNKVELAANGNEYQLTLAYESEGSQLKSLEYRLQDFSGPSKGRPYRFPVSNFKATALSPISSLKIPDWREFADEAMSVNFGKMDLSLLSGQSDRLMEDKVADLNYIEAKVQEARQASAKKEGGFLAPQVFLVGLALASIVFVYLLVGTRKTLQQSNGSQSEK